MAMILNGTKGRVWLWRCQECGKLVWTTEEPPPIGPLLDGQKAGFWEINTLFRLRLCRKCWWDREPALARKVFELDREAALARKVFEEMAKLIDDVLQELELVMAPLASSEEEEKQLTLLRQALGLAGQLYAEAASSFRRLAQKEASVEEVAAFLQKLAQGEASVEEVAARWEELAPRWEQIMQALPKMEETFAGEEIEEQQAFYLFTTAPLLWRLLTQPPELGDKLEAL
jgi:hypothetical protein